MVDTTLSQASLDVIAAAQASYKKFQAKRPAPVSVSLGQYAVESGWGKHLSGTFNYFGIKANPAQIAAGKYTERTTKEQRPDGSEYEIVAKFANFDSMQDAFDAHATLLTSPNYIDCQNAKTIEDYCYALKKDHYATALTYPQSLFKTITDNRLTDYDLPPWGNANTTPADPPASTAGGSGGSDPAAGATKRPPVTTPTPTPAPPPPVVAPAPPVVPSTPAVPTAAPPVRIDWGDVGEQILSAFAPQIVAAVNAGLELGAHAVPGGELVVAIGEKMIDQVVASAAVSFEGMLKGQSITIAPHNAIEGMVLNKIKDELPLLSAFLSTKLPAWISAAVAKIIPTVPALAQAAAAANPA